MIRNSTKGGLSKSGSTIHIEEFDCPSSKLDDQDIDDKLIIYIGRFGMKDWKVQVFSRIGILLDSKIIIH